MKRSSRWLSLALAAALLAGGAVSAGAATEHWNDASANTAASGEWSEWKSQWNDVKQNYEQVALTPGSDASRMNFAWYSRSAAPHAKVRLSKTPSMAGAREYDGQCSYYKEMNGLSYYGNRVTAGGLEANTTYYYQYRKGSYWSDTYSFKTQNPDAFSVLFVGDPQIGASVGQTPSGKAAEQTGDLAARNDAYNWDITLNTALERHPNLSFMISAGDQINEYVKDDSEEALRQQEYEYAGFLSPAALRSLPVATTIGNHDSLTENYKNHFYNPNSFTKETGATVAGNGYYYSYGDALFIVLNTNNYNCADHKNLIAKAVQSNPDANWRVVTFHQDIYGSGLDHSDSDGMILRTQLTPVLDEYDIDVVLQGHDHTYSRTYQLTGDAQEHRAYGKDVDLDNASVKERFLSENLCYSIVDKTQGTVTDPKGTVYISSNSSTGSKYYELIPTQQDYIAARSQTWKPTYSVIDIDKDSFTINTYDVESGEKIDQEYSIVKTASR